MTRAGRQHVLESTKSTFYCILWVMNGTHEAHLLAESLGELTKWNVSLYDLCVVLFYLALKLLKICTIWPMSWIYLVTPMMVGHVGLASAAWRLLFLKLFTDSSILLQGKEWHRVHLLWTEDIDNWKVSVISCFFKHQLNTNQILFVASHCTIII